MRLQLDYEDYEESEEDGEDGDEDVSDGSSEDEFEDAMEKLTVTDDATAATAEENTA